MCVVPYMCLVSLTDTCLLIFIRHFEGAILFCVFSFISFVVVSFYKVFFCICRQGGIGTEIKGSKVDDPVGSRFL